MHILHKFVLIQLTQKCVKTTQSCVYRTNTRICVLLNTIVYRVQVFKIETDEYFHCIQKACEQNHRRFF